MSDAFYSFTVSNRSRPLASRRRSRSWRRLADDCVSNRSRPLASRRDEEEGLLIEVEEPFPIDRVP